MPQAKVSQKTIARLSHYARCLRRAKADGTEVITSGYLSGRCRISSAVVRKDLSLFGEFGKQGSGYEVSELLRQIKIILGTTTPPSIVLIGAGNVGKALLESGFGDIDGYNYTAIFDTDNTKTGQSISGLTVLPMSELKQVVLNPENVIGVIAVPIGEGQVALDALRSVGCKAVLSVTLEPLEIPDGLVVRYVEIPTKLDILSHSLKQMRTHE